MSGGSHKCERVEYENEHYTDDVKTASLQMSYFPQYQGFFLNFIYTIVVVLFLSQYLKTCLTYVFKSI